ncbi:unnamed protein product [Kluyveromyces dobzhanskii CBS 2104]|uniref:WGS project CCBQ000000000 data, contig 00099 n=1 Tax=Kluyveromyces dobzhanskii CBS 2104 TaxID=1427455 RepID=A0A0A8L404_9SACH|nr:unnamed protein product [Kluyveromyces dobzhanskii CBS 2104]
MRFLDQASENSSLYQNSDSDWRIELPLSLLSDSFDKQGEDQKHDLVNRSDEEWLEIFEKSVFFQGKDPLVWGHFLACVYLDPISNKFGSFFVDKLGATHFPNVSLNENSIYHPAILNLSEKNKGSNVRKVLACSLLEKYATVDEPVIKKITNGAPLKFQYDQTHAGDLANACKIVEYCTPGNMGKSIMLHGLVHPRSVQSLLVDVVYENRPEAIDANNELVFYLGDQLEQLFDPLTEYSPEQTERVYITPEFSPEEQEEKDEPLINSICQELLTLQTNFTLSIIEFLQKVLIPLRIEVLNEDIPTLSAAKLNRLFPPTIDEVTRINCIFLDALKSATPYGAVEVLKACSVTVPYFYKAYSRHEAATKNFSKDIKLFLQKFKHVIPNSNVYTEMKIETIIKGPQEKLMKIKLILERLWQSKRWSTPEIQNDAKKHFQNTMEIVDSFGKLDASSMSAYNTRVFTPSGKILTELAKGWPLELQYKWLKRRIVGVFDVIDADNNNKRDLVVIFSDYVVILNIVDAEKYYVETDNKPLISDVLMNSLINEVALPPKIPKLQVVSHCYIDKVLTSTTKDNSITFTFLNSESPEIFVYKLASSKIRASHIEELCTKATILDKVTAFHLFISNRNNFNIYFTAHELEAYQNETIKSRFTLFLNCPPSIHQLKEHNIDLAFFATLDGGKVFLTKMTLEGTCDNVEVSQDELVTVLTREIMQNYPKYTYSFGSPFYKELMGVNEKLTRLLGHDFKLIDIQDPPAINTDPVEKGSSANIATTHKKDKSYGTITTFRSSISDFKDTLLSTEMNKTKSKKSALETQGTDSSKIENTSKPKSFLSKMFSIFKKKKSTGSKTGNTTVKTGNSKLKAAISKDLPLAAPTTKGHSSKEDRIGSVVHNKIPDAKLQVENAIVHCESNSNSISDSDDQTGKVDLQEPTKLDSVYTQPQHKRQSQVFNDDLYGDLGIASSIVPEKTTTLGEEQKLDNPTYQKTELCKVVTPQSFDIDNSFTSLEPNTRNVITIETNPVSAAEAFEETDDRDITFDEPKKEDEQAETKSPIFPKINKYVIPKINFTKSPSFAELFKEMRMVLDDSDEIVNWRRLSSEVSLNEKYAIHKNSEDDSKTIKRLSIPIEVPEQEEFVKKDEPQFDQKTLDTVASTVRSPKLPGSFNVIKASPAKIISHDKLFQKRMPRSSNSNTDPPSFYPVENAENARLVELTFHSQEELSENPFYTPLTEPSEVFDYTEDQTAQQDCLVHETTREPETKIGSSKPESAPLLEDLEFSFFHMSFDDTNNTSTRESTVEMKTEFDKNGELPRKVEAADPVFYKFNNFTKSSESFFSAHDKINSATTETDDEPIWISPSKLDMFDICNKSDTFFKSLQLPPKNKATSDLSSTVLPNSKSVRKDEPSFLRDSSYDYLGRFVADDQEQEEELDCKPTRLQFRP